MYRAYKVNIWRYVVFDIYYLQLYKLGQQKNNVDIHFNIRLL